MTLNNAVIEFRLSDFYRSLLFIALSRVRGLYDIAFRTRIYEGRFKKLRGIDKVARDLQRR